jgi:hypothetical protein
MARSTRFSHHLGAVLLLIGSACVVIAIWIAVQATRPDPLPTLVWSPKISDAQVMAASPMVLDRLGHGWWWIYATPPDRKKLKEAGASIALAMPTPLAQMAGCSLPAPVDLKLNP